MNKTGIEKLVFNLKFATNTADAVHKPHDTCFAHILRCSRARRCLQTSSSFFPILTVWVNYLSIVSVPISLDLLFPFPFPFPLDFDLAARNAKMRKETKWEDETVQEQIQLNFSKKRNESKVENKKFEQGEKKTTRIGWYCTLEPLRKDKCRTVQRTNRRIITKWKKWLINSEVKLKLTKRSVDQKLSTSKCGYRTTYTDFRWCKTKRKQSA